MENLAYSIWSGLGAFLGILIPVIVIFWIAKHNKKLTPQQKKKSDIKSVLIMGAIIIFIVFALLFLAIWNIFRGS